MHLIKYSATDIDFGTTVLYAIKNKIMLLIESLYDFSKDKSRSFLDGSDTIEDGSGSI
jgi:hypothetical protein